MHTTTLSSIAIDVVGQYGQAAKHLINAYQTGAERTVAGFGKRYEQFVESRTLPLVSDEAKAAFIGTEKRLAGLVADVVSRTGERASSTVDRIFSGAVAGVETLAKRTAWASDMFVVNALRTINLPPAQLSLDIAGKVNQATQRLSERVAATPVAQPVMPAAPRATRTPAKRGRRAAANA